MLEPLRLRRLSVAKAFGVELNSVERSNTIVKCETFNVNQLRTRVRSWLEVKMTG